MLECLRLQYHVVVITFVCAQRTKIRPDGTEDVMYEIAELAKCIKTQFLLFDDTIGTQTGLHNASLDVSTEYRSIFQTASRCYPMPNLLYILTTHPTYYIQPTRSLSS